MWRLQKVVNNVIPKWKYYSKTLQRGLNCDISEEVRFGLETNKPIVALESTIITHGMPYPENIKCALDVENIIRDQDAIPATIAILGGKITIGLNRNQIEDLADTKKSTAIKTSRRDFAYVLSQKFNGGTTVSGTIIAAEKVGISVFATGGVGGVHRQGENTLDISADLTELGRNSIAVVSSGVKSILDIPRTLEYLETQGVFVATLDSSGTTDFPAFYTSKSGTHAPYNVRSPQEAAKIILASLELGLKSGMLFAVPIPEVDALDEKLMEDGIKLALEQAAKEGVTGKHVTPFLLRVVAEITQGKSLTANMALIKNNAKIGAQIAVELSRCRSRSRENAKENVKHTEGKSSEIASPVSTSV